MPRNKCRHFRLVKSNTFIGKWVFIFDKTNLHTPVNRSIYGLEMDQMLVNFHFGRRTGYQLFEQNVLRHVFQRNIFYYWYEREMKRKYHPNTEWSEFCWILSTAQTNGIHCGWTLGLRSIHSSALDLLSTLITPISNYSYLFTSTQIETAMSASD